MAVTATFTQDDNGRQFVGNGIQVSGSYALSGTYETGGFAIAASDFGLNVIETLTVNSAPWETTEAYTAAFDSGNSKIKLGWTGAVVSTELDEITNADDVSGVAVAVTARGR